MANNTDGR